MPRNEFKAGDEQDDNPLEKEVLERFDRGDLPLRTATDEEINVLIQKSAVTINQVRAAKGQPTEGPRMICRKCVAGKHAECLAPDMCECKHGYIVCEPCLAGNHEGCLDRSKCECECFAMNKSSGLTTTEALVEEMRKKD